MPTRRDFIHQSIGVAAAAIPIAAQADAPATRHRTRAGTHGTSSAYGDTLEAARAATGVTGASFAYWDGSSLHTAVSGVRNSVTRDPVTLDTLMHIGSITKVMNATLVMQLVDEGRIALEDPVTRHLPDLRTRDLASLNRITCAMLLNHTSGLNCEWLKEYGPDQERIVDSIQRCVDVTQLFPPGAETSYCNMATVIAGYMVQQLRGTSWYTLVKSRIYEPLDMRHSLVDIQEVPRFRASVGDLTDGDSGKMVQTTRPFLAPSFAPAGSTQMTTATDLVTFARALINGGVGSNGTRFVSETSARRMATPTAEFVQVGPTKTQVGLGWMISPGGVLSHGGGGPGVHSIVFAQPSTGRAMALLINCDKGSALQARFLDPIVETWTGIKPTRVSRQDGRVDPAPYVGTYESNADRYTVSATGSGLALITRDLIDTYDNSIDREDSPAPLHPLGDDTFEVGEASTPGDERLIRFVRPDSGGKMRFLASWDRLLARSA